MTNFFFTADQHFGHAGILRHQSETRPFNSVEEMDEAMIERWNRVVGKGDVVRVLGDFSFYSPEKTREILKRLNGQKSLIRGNHDASSDRPATRKCWSTIKDYDRVKVPRTDFPSVRQPIVLSHYAMRSWHGSFRGAWMLHGHSHGTLTDYGGLICDVGVDCWDLAPVSMKQLEEFMTDREMLPDHAYTTEETNP